MASTSRAHQHFTTAPASGPSSATRGSLKRDRETGNNVLPPSPTSPKPSAPAQGECSPHERPSSTPAFPSFLPGMLPALPQFGDEKQHETHGGGGYYDPAGMPISPPPTADPNENRVLSPWYGDGHPPPQKAVLPTLAFSSGQMHAFDPNKDSPSGEGGSDPDAVALAGEDEEEDDEERASTSAYSAPGPGPLAVEPSSSDQRATKKRKSGVNLRGAVVAADRQGESSSRPVTRTPSREGSNPHSTAGGGEGDDKARRKIQIEYIEKTDKRHITFSKRKAGIMKKAYELSTLTGTQVLLLVVSDSGRVYTYTTDKFKPLVEEPEGQRMIAACLVRPFSCVVLPFTHLETPCRRPSMAKDLILPPSVAATDALTLVARPSPRRPRLPAARPPCASLAPKATLASVQHRASLLRFQCLSLPRQCPPRRSTRPANLRRLPRTPFHLHRNSRLSNGSSPSTTQQCRRIISSATRTSTARRQKKCRRRSGRPNGQRPTHPRTSCRDMRACTARCACSLSSLAVSHRADVLIRQMVEPTHMYQAQPPPEHYQGAPQQYMEGPPQSASRIYIAPHHHHQQQAYYDQQQEEDQPPYSAHSQ